MSETSDLPFGVPPSLEGVDLMQANIAQGILNGVSEMEAIADNTRLKRCAIKIGSQQHFDQASHENRLWDVVERQRENVAKALEDPNLNRLITNSAEPPRRIFWYEGGDRPMVETLLFRLSNHVSVAHNVYMDANGRPSVAVTSIWYGTGEEVNKFLAERPIQSKAQEK